MLEESGDYYKVRTHEGFIGYVRKDVIGEVEEIIESNSLKESAPALSAALPGKVNMVWHQVFNMTANGSIQEKMAAT